jgi:hypothetical protein
MSDWQPIETAPKRKRSAVIDVWAVIDDPGAARFYFGATCCGVPDKGLWQGRVTGVHWLDGAWRPHEGLARLHPLEVTVTHWMPLPDPPVAA